MLMPSIFGETFLDSFFDEPFMGGFEEHSLMNTDIEDTDQGYVLTMDMPGVQKEDVKAQLKDGYLTIQATSGSNNDEKDPNGRYIRRERYYGSVSRSFYVGEDVTEEDIRAKFEDGTLKILIPKQEEKPKVDQKKYIAIEG